MRSGRTMDNRRKTLVTNKKFQYQQTLMIVSITVIVANLFLVGSVLIPDAPALALSRGTALVIGLIELALMAAVWYGGIWASNKVAGPVYVFSRQIGLFSEGDLGARISLRKHDFFAEEAEQINRSLDRIQSQVEEVVSAVHGLRNAREASGQGSREFDELMDKLAVFGSSEN